MMTSKGDRMEGGKEVPSVTREIRHHLRISLLHEFPALPKPCEWPLRRVPALIQPEICELVKVKGTRGGDDEELNVVLYTVLY